MYKYKKNMHALVTLGGGGGGGGGLIYKTINSANIIL